LAKRHAGALPQKGPTMALQIQDVLLLILLPLVGGLAGYLMALQRTRGADSAQPAQRHRIDGRLDPSARPSAVASAPWWLPAGPIMPEAADLLLVDDSAVARAKLRRLFEAAGYRVHLACDGVEALALLEKGRYAMMITDLEMPNMDGVTLINTCLDRPQFARMPIVAISGHEGLRAKFNECRNIAGVHRKPWVDDILLSHVATLIGARSARVAALA
jgi:CheY-like chemotaxis protein